MERERKLTESYDEAIKTEKGDSLYFVPQSDIKSIMLLDAIEIDFNIVQVADNVSFLDQKGNIVYQTICRKIDKDSIYIECYDFNIRQNYLAAITHSDFSKIPDLTKFEISGVKVFREIKR